MHTNRSSPRNPNRAVREKFRKRRTSLIKKADELAYMCQADIYLVVYRGDKYYSYSSCDRDDWPPSEEEMAKHYPLREHSGPDDVRPVRKSTRNDDGDISEQSEDPRASDPQSQYPEQPATYPKRTRRLPRPPQLTFAQDDPTARQAPVSSHDAEHQSLHPLRPPVGISGPKKTFVIPSVPQLPLFQSIYRKPPDQAYHAPLSNS